MDSNRAKEILQSNENIQVLYRGQPVWIDSVQSNNTAIVSRLGIDRNDKEEVPVYLLVENTRANT